MTGLKTPKYTSGSADLTENYRPLALPAVAAAFAIKRPVVAVSREVAIDFGNTQADGFWTPKHDDDF